MTRKTRDLNVNFQAVIQYTKGVYEVLGDNASPLVAIMVYALGASPPMPTVSELAAAAGVDLKSASRTLKELRKRKWVQLVGDPVDTRKRHAGLTPQGDAIIRLLNGALTDTAFRIVENTMGQHPRARHKVRIKR